MCNLSQVATGARYLRGVDLVLPKSNMCSIWGATIAHQIKHMFDLVSPIAHQIKHMFDLVSPIAHQIKHMFDLVSPTAHQIKHMFDLVSHVVEELLPKSNTELLVVEKRLNLAVSDSFSSSFHIKPPIYISTIHILQRKSAQILFHGLWEGSNILDRARECFHRLLS